MIIIIKKKKILFVIILLCVCFFGVKRINKTEEVSAIILENKTIILDAGHGFPDEGAVAKDGTSEEKINLEIVLKLQELLKLSGVDVILTRVDENGIYDTEEESIRNKKVSDMKNRVKIGNTSNADIFVSIHLNKFENEKYKGYQTFYNKKNEKSERLAKLIQENLKQTMKDKNKRESLSIKNKYLMDNLKIPAVIIECGFLSNKEDLENLKQEEYQKKIAWGIYLGIMEFFEEKQ